MMIKELDTVALTRDIPDKGLKKGDFGAAMFVYEDGGPVEVE